jgi:hypothetical protein
MNASLDALLKAHEVSGEDARETTADMVGFAEMVQRRPW